MILGIGTDIVHRNRVKKIYDKYESRFLERVFGVNEINTFNSLKQTGDLFLAKRFAGKEATWKALSFDRGSGLVFTEIEILNHINGKPYLFFSGKTKKLISSKERSLKAKLKFDISLSDEPPYVLAFVIISLAPSQKVMHKV